MPKYPAKILAPRSCADQTNKLIISSYRWNLARLEPNWLTWTGLTWCQTHNVTTTKNKNTVHSMTSPEGGRHEAVEEKVHWGVDCEEYVWDWVHQEYPQGEAAATVVVVLLYLYKGEKSRDESEPGPTVLSWLIDCFWGYLRLERSKFVCCCLGLGWKGSRKPGLGWSTSTYGMKFFFWVWKVFILFCLYPPSSQSQQPNHQPFFPGFAEGENKTEGDDEWGSW